MYIYSVSNVKGTFSLTMDLLKTPSTQSLLESDLESVESLQYVDFEEVIKIMIQFSKLSSRKYKYNFNIVLYPIVLSYICSPGSNFLSNCCSLMKSNMPCQQVKHQAWPKFYHHKNWKSIKGH